MPCKRQPSKHNISAIKRAMTAMAAATKRPVSEARFFPDGSFVLTVGPTKTEASNNPWDEVLTNAADEKRSA
jgi:hypothetical protein